MRIFFSVEIGNVLQTTGTEAMVMNLSAAHMNCAECLGTQISELQTATQRADSGPFFSAEVPETTSSGHAHAWPGTLPSVRAAGPHASSS